MKIYSWNILFNNHEFDRAFEFIAQSDFDIFCLQEVPEEFLKRLMILPCSIVHTIESDIIFNGERAVISSVILSKHTIIRSGDISLKHYAPELPWRTHFIRRIMYELRIWADGIGNRHALYADIETAQDKSVHVLNLHLPLMHPNIRAEEFELAMAERDGAQSTIVCGDFNILEKPHITLLNWLFGGRMTDALLYKRERTHIEKRFVAYELLNALSGKITHPISRSQLDHILVSHSFLIKNAEVISDRFGSDHHPITATIS